MRKLRLPLLFILCVFTSAIANCNTFGKPLVGTGPVGSLALECPRRLYPMKRQRAPNLQTMATMMFGSQNRGGHALLFRQLLSLSCFLPAPPGQVSIRHTSRHTPPDKKFEAGRARRNYKNTPQAKHTKPVAKRIFAFLQKSVASGFAPGGRAVAHLPGP